MTIDVPKPPTEMGHAGENVWAWADALSQAAHKAHKIRELSGQIRAMEGECGSCTKWMTNDCPKEVHDNRKGYKVGPSSRAPKCNQFTMSSSHARRVEAAKEDLATLIGS